MWRPLAHACSCSGESRAGVGHTRTAASVTERSRRCRPHRSVSVVSSGPAAAWHQQDRAASSGQAAAAAAAAAAPPRPRGSSLRPLTPPMIGAEANGPHRATAPHSRPVGDLFVEPRRACARGLRPWARAGAVSLWAASRLSSPGVLQRLDRGGAGQGATVLVTGDAGIGKTRLAAEVASAAGPRVSRCCSAGRSTSSGRSCRSNPLVYVLRPLGNPFRDEVRASQLHVFESGLAAAHGLKRDRDPADCAHLRRLPALLHLRR